MLRFAKHFIIGSQWESHFRYPGGRWEDCGTLIVNEVSSHVVYFTCGPDCKCPMAPTRLLGQPWEYYSRGGGKIFIRRTPWGDSLYLKFDPMAQNHRSRNHTPHTPNYPGFLKHLQTTIPVPQLAT